MSTFTAVALDRLIDSGATKSMAPARKSPDSITERWNSTQNSGVKKGVNGPSSKLERGVSVPPDTDLKKRVGVSPSLKRDKGSYSSTINRRNSDSAALVSDRTHYWTQITPALYTTPASTPLPDSPSSFPPSPYVINHKRRGPRLMKSFSEDDVVSESVPHENVNLSEKEIATVTEDDSFVSDELIGSTRNDNCNSTMPGDVNVKHGNCEISNGSARQNGGMNSDSFLFSPTGDYNDFLDSQEAMTVQSNGETDSNHGAEVSLSSITPLAEFYDAWEELSSDSGHQHVVKDTENELREIRLSLLMEIEKRKQAEESLMKVRNEWQRICVRLSPLGLTLPADLATLPEDERTDPAAEVFQQVFVARYVSNLIGRGTAKAEVEMEMQMQEQISLKNFEIARLVDRLNYYETVNQEMSQRNQQVVETARRLRQQRKIRQRWVFGSVAAAITLGSAVLGWSYFKSGKGSSSSNLSIAREK